MCVVNYVCIFCRAASHSRDACLLPLCGGPFVRKTQQSEPNKPKETRCFVPRPRRSKRCEEMEKSRRRKKAENGGTENNAEAKIKQLPRERACQCVCICLHKTGSANKLTGLHMVRREISSASCKRMTFRFRFPLRVSLFRHRSGLDSFGFSLGLRSS